MSQKFSLPTLFLSILVGFLFIVCLSLISSVFFATALMPSYAMLAGYILTGITIGYYSKGVTIVEPGLGAIVASAVSAFVISSFDLKGLSQLWTSDWILLSMNGVILTFVGAWVGEMFQSGKIKKEESSGSSFEWDWIIIGAIIGVTFSLLLVSIFTLFLGYQQTNYIIPFFISLFATGYVVGFKSPGVTIKEAGLAGFLTIVMDINIIRFTLLTETEIGSSVILLGLVLGFITALIGGFVGEKVQSSKSK